MKQGLLAATLIIGSVALFPLTPTPLRAGKDNIPTSESHATKVFDVLLPIVYSSSKAVRLYYCGACNLNDSPVPFPGVKVKAPAKGKSGLAAIRDIFANDADVTVTAGPDGLI